MLEICVNIMLTLSSSIKNKAEPSLMLIKLHLFIAVFEITSNNQPLHQAAPTQKYTGGNST